MNLLIFHYIFLESCKGGGVESEERTIRPGPCCPRPGCFEYFIVVGRRVMVAELLRCGSGPPPRIKLYLLIIRGGTPLNHFPNPALPSTPITLHETSALPHQQTRNRNTSKTSKAPCINIYRLRAHSTVPPCSFETLVSMAGSNICIWQVWFEPSTDWWLITLIYICMSLQLP